MLSAEPNKYFRFVQKKKIQYYIWLLWKFSVFKYKSVNTILKPFTGKFMKKFRQKFQDRLADAGTQAEESLSSIRTVRTFSGERKACDLYGADVDKSYDIGKKLAMLGGLT